uniref:Uncharacterized protein n=1 Tax=Wuchereria bancrofti TaxID=6293 RepID=A0AAF5PQY5_WUCBA
MPRDHHYGRFNINANAYISEQIRNEIQRFESVHPCIYTVYDLIELIPDQLLQNQLRDQVVCIEAMERMFPDDIMPLLGLAILRRSWRIRNSTRDKNRRSYILPNDLPNSYIFFNSPKLQLKPIMNATKLLTLRNTSKYCCIEITGSMEKYPKIFTCGIYLIK